ncbi:MAG: hypothetical protein BGO54_04775 [Sphingobacteriales bacterium 46-32]|nr:MAG: hypothetical protein BGO54_04775 [Sphingobacteriales bacterium 46-32]
MLALGVSAPAQSLKEALYGGKLKLDSGAVIRKGDDLKAHIDTSTRKPVVAEKQASLSAAKDSLTQKGQTSQLTNAATQQEAADNPVAGTTSPAVGNNTGTNAAADNNKVWKDYIDELMTAIRTDVLPSKKIKNGTYYVLVDYEIDVDGQVAVKNITCSPGSEYLEEQVRERINLTAPRLTPLLNTYGKPRKAAKKQNLTITK